MLIIGIDPGITGAICFFEDGEVKDIIEMPNMPDGKKNKRQINGSQIFNEISVRIKDIPKKEVLVVMEQVSAMPGQGVTSMFNFGQSFGVIKGICSAMQLSVHLVRPVKWKKYYNLINISVIRLILSILIVHLTTGIFLSTNEKPTYNRIAIIIIE